MKDHTHNIVVRRALAMGWEVGAVDRCPKCIKLDAEEAADTVLAASAADWIVP